MKPSIPKGTRDFLPQEVYRRQYLFDIIRKAFVTFGFQPIETPVMENLSTLNGKYGDEGDQLLFKVLNNGDFLAKAPSNYLENKDSKNILRSISKRGLRYDLTVPLARFVVMHQNEITFPFKRYAIQQVWRADRPQKGRYQEFYQCDADVVGSPSLMYESELILLFDTVYKQLELPCLIKVNNRKVLQGIAEIANVSDLFVEMTAGLDKLDKVGIQKVKEEWIKSGISQESMDRIIPILNVNKLEELEPFLKKSQIGMLGIDELRELHQYLDTQTISNRVELDVSLARGLNYYTGCIFEVIVDPNIFPSIKIGSIGGGGRYDDLTAVFGLRGVSGVGISFGLARIYDVLTELELLEKVQANALDALFLALDKESHLWSYQLVNKLRNKGLSVDLYPAPDKLKKQMKYANAIRVPYAILVGSEERSMKMLHVKNMLSGEEQKLSPEELNHFLLEKS